MHFCLKIKHKQNDKKTQEATVYKKILKLQLPAQLSLFSKVRKERNEKMQEIISGVSQGSPLAIVSDALPTALRRPAFWDVNLIYGWKFRLRATRLRNRKTQIAYIKPMGYLPK